MAACLVNTNHHGGEGVSKLHARTQRLIAKLESTQRSHGILRTTILPKKASALERFKFKLHHRSKKHENI